MSLRGSLGRGIRLPHDLFLTNSRDQIKGLLSDKFERLAGMNETETLRQTQSAIYNISDQPNDLAKHDDKVRQFLELQLRHVQLFLTALWLVKDNSVNTEMGFLEYPHGSQTGSWVSSNFLALRFSKADGSIGDTEFTESEARNARDVQSKLFKTTGVRNDESRGYVLPYTYNRLSRVFFFTQGARNTSNLGEKIASYMTCFEALFCTDSAEIAHKLSERVAFFLAESPTERASIFGNVKIAYDIRSKTLHGNTLKPKRAEQAPSVASQCDELLRKTLRKIISTPGLPETFTGDSDLLEKYLIRLVLGSQ